MVTVRVHQIYYRPEQRAHLDPAFIPYDNTANENPEWREYWVFQQAYAKGLHREADYVGFFSHRYNEKVRVVSGQQFIDFVHANPGYDAYFINPFPDLAELNPNPWLQGDDNHPGLLRISQHVFDGAGYALQLRSLNVSANTIVYSNYWVATAPFWEAYMAFTRPLHRHIEAGLTSRERFEILKSVYHDGASHIPFIMERTFTTFVSLHEQYRVAAYPYERSTLVALVDTLPGRRWAHLVRMAPTRRAALAHIWVLRSSRADRMASLEVRLRAWLSRAGLAIRLRRSWRRLQSEVSRLFAR